MVLQIAALLARSAKIGAANKALNAAGKKLALTKALDTANRAAGLPEHLAKRVEAHLKNGLTGPANQIINRYTRTLAKVSKNSPFSAGVEAIAATKDYRAATASGRRAVAFHASYEAKAAGLSEAEIIKARRDALNAFNASARRFVRVQGLSPSQKAKVLEGVSRGRIDVANEQLTKAVRSSINSARNYLENPTNDPGFRARVPHDPRLETRVMQATLRGANPRTLAREMMQDRVELNLHPAGVRKRVKGKDVRTLAKAAQAANRAIETLRNAGSKTDDQITKVLGGLMDNTAPGVWTDQSGVDWDRDDLESLGGRLYKIEARGIHVSNPLDAVTKMSKGIFATIANDGDAFIRGLITSFDHMGLSSSAPNVFNAIITRAKTMSDRERTAAAGHESYQMFFSSSSTVVRAFIGRLLRQWGLDPNDFDPAELAAI